MRMTVYVDDMQCCAGDSSARAQRLVRRNECGRAATAHLLRGLNEVPEIAERGAAIAAAPGTGRAYATKLLAFKLATQQLSQECARAHARNELRQYLADPAPQPKERQR
jgi:hypothetical protein